MNNEITEADLHVARALLNDESDLVLIGYAVCRRSPRGFETDARALAQFRADARADALRPLLEQFEDSITAFQNHPGAARAWTDAAHMVRELLK